jgi:hypothetical protein
MRICRIQFGRRNFSFRVVGTGRFARSQIIADRLRVCKSVWLQIIKLKLSRVTIWPENFGPVIFRGNKNNHPCPLLSLNSSLAVPMYTVLCCPWIRCQPLRNNLSVFCANCCSFCRCQCSLVPYTSIPWNGYTCDRLFSFDLGLSFRPSSFYASGRLDTV